MLLMSNSFCTYITWYVYVVVDLDMLYFDDQKPGKNKLHFEAMDSNFCLMFKLGGFYFIQTSPG